MQIRLNMYLKLIFFAVILTAFVAADKYNITIHEMPSYEVFNANIHTIKRDLLKEYPKWMDKEEYREDYFITFPPPKGSRMVAQPDHNGGYIVVTDVYVKIVVEGFVRMNIEEHSVTIAVRETYAWNDESLRNNSLHQSYPIQLEIDIDRIWTPRLYARSIFESGTIHEEKFVRVSPAYKDGSENGCFLEREMLYTIPCSVNVKNFPFDVHNCSLVITQPPNMNYRMHLIPMSNMSTEDHTNSMYEMDYTILDWRLEGSNDHIQNKTFKYNHHSFQLEEYKVNFLLRRCSFFYSIVLVCPCILLNLVSLTIFTLPIKDVERENFALNLLLTYFVFILLVVESSPPSGNMMPLLGLYTILSTCVLMVTFVMSLILIELNEHKRSKKRKMPRTCKALINNKFCLWMFTNKETYSYLYKKAKPVDQSQTDGTLIARIESIPVVSIADIKNEQQWKIFCKLLNFVFFMLTLIGHIVIGIILYSSSYVDLTMM